MGRPHKSFSFSAAIASCSAATAQEARGTAGQSASAVVRVSRPAPAPAGSGCGRSKCAAPCCSAERLRCGRAHLSVALVEEAHEGEAAGLLGVAVLQATAREWNANCLANSGSRSGVGRGPRTRGMYTSPILPYGANCGGPRTSAPQRRARPGVAMHSA